MKRLANGVFEGCRKLTSIVIPNGVKKIAKDAFYSCDGLKSITIPDSVETIGRNAFAGSRSQTEVHISNLAKWCNNQVAFPYGKGNCS